MEFVVIDFAKENCLKMERLEHNLRMRNIKLLRIPEISLKSSWVDIFAEFED